VIIFSDRVVADGWAVMDCHGWKLASKEASETKDPCSCLESLTREYHGCKGDSCQASPSSRQRDFECYVRRCRGNAGANTLAEQIKF